MRPAHKLRTIIIVVATALAFALSLLMIANYIGYGSPWLALLLMFDAMAVAKVAEPLFVLRVPGRLHEVRRWEQGGAFYRKLGVLQFGMLLRNTPLRFLNAGVYLNPAARDLHSLSRRVASAEATHFWAALFFMAYILYLYLAGRPGIATGFLAVQVFVNVYPIFHLRLLRARLGSLLRRQAAFLERAHAVSAGVA